MTELTTRSAGTAPAAPGFERKARDYWPFVVPALVTVGAVIVFPWVFTIWMGMHEWKVGGERSFVGLANYLRLASDERFIGAIGHTVYYTALSVVLPLVLGTLAAVIFHERFPLRGLLRGIFIMPMMATPVAIALVWVMMFHPQLGVLNYLLSLVGIAPQHWVFNINTVIPSLVLVETWQWSPLVMLIVLGGLASLPTEPYESALIDGASRWQMFRHITVPSVRPSLVVVLTTIAMGTLKVFDIVRTMTGGQFGTSVVANEFYTQSFRQNNQGLGAALAVILFIIILPLIVYNVRQMKKTEELR